MDISNSNIKVRSKFVLKDDSVVSKRSRAHFEDVEPTWFNNLPVKVLVNIFKYFEERELRKWILPVCQHWKYAAQRPVLWKKLALRGTHVPLYFICKQIRMFTELESVLIDNITEATTVIRQICRCLPGIKHLAIRYCSSIPETALRFIIGSCKMLQTLDLCGTEVRGTFVYRCLSGIPNLRKLNLTDNPHLYVKALISVVLNCAHLEDLRISKFSNKRDSFQNEDAILILSNLTETLKSLSLDCTLLSSTTIQLVFDCSKLERLGLFGATNLTGAQFTNVPHKFRNLKQLKIRNAHQIANCHVISVFTNGKSTMKNLVYLDFAGCFKISDESIKVIADCCHQLQHLALKSCKNITDLAPILRSNPQITTLNIAFMMNLNVESILPLLYDLQKLFIDESRLLDKWLETFKENNSGAVILVCRSEYNRRLSNINVLALKQEK